MLNILQVILSLTVILFAGYVLFTGKHEFQPFLMLLVGLTTMVMGFREFQKGHKGYGWLSIVVSMFIFFVSIESFILI